MLTRRCQDCFSIAVQLFLGFCSVNHSDNRKHHSLVTSGKVIQELLRLLSLLFHVIRNHCRKVVVAVLAALPVGDVGLYTEQAVFNLSNSLVRRNRNDVDREHHVSVQLGKLGYHAVLDIRSIILEVNHTGKSFTDLQIIRILLNAVRADIISEIVTLLHHVPGIESEEVFLTGAVEVMKHTESLRCRKFDTFRPQCSKVCLKICRNTGKVSSGFFHRLFGDRNGNKLFLHDAFRIDGFVQEHAVILSSVLIAPVALHRHEAGIFEVRFIHLMIVDGDLCSCAAVQAVEQFRISQEHVLLILTGSNHIVDIREFEGLGELATDLKNAIRPDAGNRDNILNSARNLIAFLILSQDGFNRFQHALCTPPFHEIPRRPSWSRSRCC